MKPFDFLRLPPALPVAPIRDLQTLVGEGPVFVLAPHPDDESIGCGGLIAASAAARIPVFVHVLTDGRHSHPGSRVWPPERIAERREAEARRAGAHLGLAPEALRFERELDGSLLFDWSNANNVAARIAEQASRWRTPIIVAPWRADPHPDHMATSVIADLVEQACSGARGLRYLVWAKNSRAIIAEAAERGGAVRFPISPYRKHKRRAVRAYRSQSGRLITDTAKTRSLPRLSDFIGRYETYLLSTV